MTDKTVSACPDCRAVTSGHCPKHPWGDDFIPTPTHSPTDRLEHLAKEALETFTEEDKKRIRRESPTETVKPHENGYIDYGNGNIIPPTEPTVEKWDWREYLIRSIFSGEEVGIRRIFKLPPKRQCWVEWKHLEKTVSHILSLSVQEAKAEMVAEIENSKIISSIGYRPSKFRGLSTVAIYNMALDDLRASLKQEEEKG